MEAVAQHIAPAPPSDLVQADSGMKDSVEVDTKNESTALHEWWVDAIAKEEDDDTLPNYLKRMIISNVSSHVMKEGLMKAYTDKTMNLHMKPSGKSAKKEVIRSGDGSCGRSLSEY